jgi:hypothetical protein
MQNTRTLKDDMVTWCNNVMTVRASPDVIAKMEDALEESRLMNTFARVRKGATEAERIARWGTRWEIAVGDTVILEDEENKKQKRGDSEKSADKITGSFLTVDGPPLAFFNTLCTTEGVESVSVYYVDFVTPRAGTWVDGEETDFSNEPRSRKVPSDFWRIMDCMNEYPGLKV